MKVTKEKLENSQVLLKIEAEPQETESYLDRAYRKVVNKVVVPGFRKGKAPRFVLERHIGKEALLQEALEIEVPELYKKALDAEHVEAIDEPEVKVTTTEPVSFEAHVPVKPTVELGDYKSIRIPREPVEAKDTDVDDYIQSLREKNAVWEPVEHPAQMGNRVSVDVTGVIEGKKVIDEKGLHLTMAEGATIIVSGFAEQLGGMSAGEEKEFDLTFPEGSQGKGLPGKTCRFKVKVLDVKEKKLAELNDEFAISLNWSVETLEALKAKVREDLTRARENMARRKHEGQVLEAVVAASKVEYPTVLVDREIDRQAADRVRYSGAGSLENYLANVRKTQEELKEELREDAQKRVVNTLVLSEITEREKLEVTGEEIDKEVENIVKVSGGRPELVESLKSAVARESMRNNLRQRKTLELLSGMAVLPDGGGEPEKSPEH
ncbi:MAG: trigger factor [Chloroflexi bacterium]|nr:trigger factor [Chloroflexota bacterium]